MVKMVRLLVRSHYRAVCLMIEYLEISLFFPHYKRFCTHYGTFHKNEPLTFLSGIEIVVDHRAHLRSRIGKYEPALP